VYKYRAVYKPSLASTMKDIYMCNAHYFRVNTPIHVNLVKLYHVRESILKVVTVKWCDGCQLSHTN